MSDHLVPGRVDAPGSPGTRRQFLGRSGGAAAVALLGRQEAPADPVPSMMPARIGASRPATLLVKNAAVLVTMDASRGEI